MPLHPTPSKNCAISHVQNWNGFSVISMRRSMQSKQCGWRTTSCALFKVNFFQNPTYHAKFTTYVGRNDTQASPRLFATHAFPAQGLSAMLVSPGKGSCLHHRFTRALARCYCKQLVPGRLIGLRVRSFRLNIFQQNPFLLWLVKNNGFSIIKYLIWQFQIYVEKIKLRKIVLSTDLHIFSC